MIYPFLLDQLLWCRSRTLNYQKISGVTKNIFFCSVPAEEIQLSRIALFRTASHFKCSLLYIGQHSSDKSWNHQSPKWNSQHTKPSWCTFVPSLVWPLTNLVRSSDFVFLLYLFFWSSATIGNRPRLMINYLAKVLQLNFPRRPQDATVQRGNWPLVCWSFPDVFLYK